MNVVTENRFIPDYPETGFYFKEFDVNLVNFFVTIIEYEKRVINTKLYLNIKKICTIYLSIYSLKL